MSIQHSMIRSDANKSELSKERRYFLMGAGALAVSSAVTLSAACSRQSQTSQENSKQASALLPQSHQGHGGKSNKELIDSVFECIKTGQLCIDHCMELFKAGDTSVADCADALQEMLAVCAAFTQLASYKSKRLKEAAKLCIAICDDCERECRKHENHHAECKACAEACRKCIDECKRFLA